MFIYLSYENYFVRDLRTVRILSALMDRTIIRGSSAYESENDTIGITSIVPEKKH